MMHPVDVKERFFFLEAPVRGDLTRLDANGLLQEVLQAKPYPLCLQRLLAELCAAASLLVSGYKLEGRLSIQLQGSGSLQYAMAECSHTGEMRAIAGFDAQSFTEGEHSEHALSQLGADNSVMFLNLEPDQGERYQSVVERTSDKLDQCLSHYLTQSMQIKSSLQLASSSLGAGGLLLQKLPGEEEDQDAWGRANILAQTLSTEELCSLEAKEVLNRLFHQEKISLGQTQQLVFGCQCSQERTLAALRQLGTEQINALFESKTELVDGKLSVECRFCGQTRLVSRAELRTH